MIAKSDLAALPESIRKFVERYTYRHPSEPGLLVLDADNGRHMNHDGSPNTDFRDLKFGYAIADIAPGEEITCNYAEFEPDFEILPSLRETVAGKANGHDG